MVRRGSEGPPLSISQILGRGKEGRFTGDGRTLFLNGVGRQGINLLRNFTAILNGSNAVDELFGAAISDDKRRGEVEQAIGRNLRKKLRAPLFTDKYEALEAMIPGQAIGNLHAVIHFVSFDENPEQAKDAVFLFTPRTSLFHLAVVVRPSDAIERRYYERGLENLPREKFVMPMIEIDEEKCQEHDRLVGMPDWLDSKSAFLHGLAALVSGSRLLPSINSHNYRQVLAALTDNHRSIGVGIGIRETPLVKKYGGFRHTLSLSTLAEDVGMAVVDSFTDAARITFVEPSEEEEFDVVAVSTPLHHDHPYWHNGSFIPTVDKKAKEDADRQGVSMTDRVSYMYSGSPLLTNEQLGVVVAVRLFPAEPKVTSEDRRKFGEEVSMIEGSLGLRSDTPPTAA